MSEYRIPAVDRAIEVLGAMETRREPVTLRELSDQLEIPKSTVYRILNSLEAGAMVARMESGSYVLGPRLLRLAQAVTQGFDLVSLAKPVMDELARQQGATVKLSVLDSGSALVVAAAIGQATFTVSTQVGTRFPLHAGAASKTLAAWLEARELEKLLPAKLERFTDLTVVRRADLVREFATIRAQGFAKDEGEHNAGVHAYAAPIFDAEGKCVAAMSMPFFGSESSAHAQELLNALLIAGERLSQSLGAAPRLKRA
ncbi:MAG TPA: IclR family transcriptional regulator [Polaromonas sp.]|uniref:IclR family transcriptional regulator n=1 Tax=Polaromonas sp. TaxID=1869339 RepID=UPI002D74C389|nr:IclR family transcriptional regulator [Polaromonas sp.]HYW58125.1 IclR family transcriptional regulator [Polaromonas sp.]